MRIISQDGTIDIPYDRKCLFVSEDGDIRAMSNVCEASEIVFNSDIAQYSTKEKALRVVADLRDAYRSDCRYYELPKEEDVD